MSKFGWCYSQAPTKCSSGPQSGTVALRDEMMARIPNLSSYGVHNCRQSRTGSSLSRHANGTAWDARTLLDGKVNLRLNLAVGDFCVLAAQDLGIQRAICWGPRSDGTIGPREWDSRSGERFWEHYSGPSHQDHVHIELCWAASQSLTRDDIAAALARYWKGPLKEDDLNAEQDARLTKVEQRVDAIYEAVIEKRTLPDGSKSLLEATDIIERVARAVGEKLGLAFNQDGTLKT